MRRAILVHGPIKVKSAAPSPLKFQTASDIVRDGIGVELVDENGNVLAEVFRSDREHTVVVATFKDVPLEDIEELLRFAHGRLDPFDDGSSLSSAANYNALPVNVGSL
jgi:hypothetical protein